MASDRLQRGRARSRRALNLAANVVGASGAALFARATWLNYLHTHRLVGAVFVFEQTWVVVAYLARRSAERVSRRFSDWLFAFGGTFTPVLFRPTIGSPHWGIDAGFDLQLIGIGACIWSFLALGRSFGFAPADRGLVRRGPYRVIRHPIYASYVLLQAGYLLQSMSVRNAVVMLIASSCNIGRAMAEERVLAGNPKYPAYSADVRWHLVPGIW